ncbi:MAG TPA: FAD-dependent oxidoreductase [Gemmataceae bacterium]|jgi:glycine/D-amino acid oxidase-like deaminating enzyme
MSEHPDVLILGGGVIGLSTAWFLAEAGDSSRSWTRAKLLLTRNTQTRQPNIRIFSYN